MKDRVGISRYARISPNDYEFVRDSKLPRDTFSRGISPDTIAVAICIAVAAAIIVGWIA
jgi:hypothetical protein